MRAKVSSAARAAADGIGETVDVFATHAISPYSDHHDTTGQQQSVPSGLGSLSYGPARAAAHGCCSRQRRAPRLAVRQARA
jgi:hypothetical protein